LAKSPGIVPGRANRAILAGLEKNFEMILDFQSF
jgi:hypothetical protein